MKYLPCAWISGSSLLALGERVGPLGGSRCRGSGSHEGSFARGETEAGFLLAHAGEADVEGRSKQTVLHDLHHTRDSVVMSNTYQQPIDRQELMVANGRS